LRDFQGALRRGVGDINGWIAAREAELKQGVTDLEQAAEARRRQADNAARALRANVVSGVERVVEASASRLTPRTVSPSPRPAANTHAVRTRPAPPAPPLPAPGHKTQEMLAHLNAGARGAQDAFTLGLGDHFVAGAGALGDAVQGKDIAASYQERMDRERARDAEDSQNYPAARATGQVLGVGAQVLIPGAVLGRVGVMLVPAAQGARIAQAAPLILRETATLAAAGGAVGVAGQAADDVTNRKIGTPGDSGGAIVGGTLGALAARRGNVAQASAAAGFTQSVAQDTLNGGLNTQSAARARESAVAGATVGGLVGAGVARHMDGLPMKAKELTGERLSRVRNFVRGHKTGPTQKTAHKLPGGGHTLPDLRTYKNGLPQELIESKFGRKARLSPRQIQATLELKNYRVDHSVPRDIGAALGLPSSVIFPWDWAMTQPQPEPGATAP